MFELFPHQQKLVDQARDEIAKGSRGVMIVSPAGSGKSVVIAEIARLTTRNKKHVLFIVHRQELAQQIEESFVKQDVDMDYVTIYTVIRARNRLGNFPEPSVIITDETHHSRANTYREIYDHFPESFRLGFTATPWRMNGKGFTDIYDTMIEGESVQWLIDNNYLAPFKYYSIDLVSHEKLKSSSTGDYTSGSITSSLSKSVFGDIVEHYKKLANGRKAILYAHNVEYSEKITEEFNKNNISAAHADAKTPKKERDTIMQSFRDGKIQVLCNVDLISEGFNVPDCSCVILVRPTKSLVLHIQQSMRSMRYQPNKTAVIIDHVGNYMTHGLPSSEREWTIESKNKNKNDLKNVMPTKECTDCYMVVSSATRVCPGCGHEFTVESRGLVDEDAELKEIDQQAFEADYRLITINRKPVELLQTVEEIYIVMKLRNYKPGWVYFQAKTKGILPEYYSQISRLKDKYKHI